MILMQFLPFPVVSVPSLIRIKAGSADQNTITISIRKIIILKNPCGWNVERDVSVQYLNFLFIYTIMNDAEMAHSLKLSDYIFQALQPNLEENY